MTRAVYLSGNELSGLVELPEIIEAVREGYRQRGAGAAAEPRTALANDDPAGLLTGYLAVLPETGAMGGYTYSAGFGASDAWFLTPIFDANTGEPLAVLDGAWMNPLKTGAAGAVGIDALARDDARELAVIGSGTQARGQLRAATEVREFDRVRVYSPTADHRESFAAELNREVNATVAAVATSGAAIENADVVVTATNATEPVFDWARLDPGTHVTAMGQYHPEKRELDAETIARATYVPDLRERVTLDAGSFLHALETGAIEADHVDAELGEVIEGDVRGRSDPEEITVFDSGGTAIETVATAHLLYERATAEGLGTEIEVQPASDGMAA